MAEEDTAHRRIWLIHRAEKVRAEFYTFHLQKKPPPVDGPLAWICHELVVSKTLGAYVGLNEVAANCIVDIFYGLKSPYWVRA